MIKNIILDMGNVLMDFDPERILDTFCNTAEEKQRIREELFYGPEWVAGDYGEIVNSQRYDLVKERLPERLHGALKRCVDGWFDTMLPIKGVQEFLAELKQDGYHLFVLSNACNGFHYYFPKFFPLSEFDGIVVSCDVHMLKPDQQIYTYLLGQYQLNAEECFFVDDRSSNIEGARMAGIKGAQFNGSYQEILDVLKAVKVD